MSRRIDLIPAPVGLTPGGYVATAYAERTTATTTTVDMTVTQAGDGWRIELRWACAEPVRSLEGQPTRFADAAAILVPAVADAPWMSMGAPDKPVEGALWRADHDRPTRIHAAGLGTVTRAAAPDTWRTESAWENGRWRVVFTLLDWPALAASRRCAVAVWQGAAGERASLKSVSPAWLPLEESA